jgi:hypothetical protein
MFRFLIGTSMLSFPLMYWFGGSYFQSFLTCSAIGLMSMGIDWLLTRLYKLFNI